MMLVLFFGLKLDWLPVQGMVTVGVKLTGINYILDRLSHLLMPAFTLALAQLAFYARLTRASMLEELGKDYIITARGKGLKESAVFYRHAFRNAIIPVTTMAGLRAGYLIAGATLTEIVFAWPGMGRLTYLAMLNRDYPMLMAIFFMVSVIVVMFVLITDVINAYLDPRVTY
jgi:peptide/nickel transport system permease protein